MFWLLPGLSVGIISLYSCLTQAFIKGKIGVIFKITEHFTDTIKDGKFGCHGYVALFATNCTQQWYNKCWCSTKAPAHALLWTVYLAYLVFLLRLTEHTLCLEQFYGSLFQPLYTSTWTNLYVSYSGQSSRWSESAIYWPMRARAI